jgi:GT2 family glycosyltransferase
MDDRARRAGSEEELAAQVEELRRLVEVQRALGRADAATVRVTRAALRESEAERAALRREHTAFRARRSVRVGVALADRMRRLRGAIGRRPAPPAPPAQRPPAIDPGATQARLAAAADVPARTTGPLVSIVMLTRDGAGHLRRTLPALASGAYPNVELIVVDNASTDDSAAVLAAYAPGFPVTVIRNERNESYSDANNAAVRACRGSLVLFLNNDVQPVGPHWLGHLVESMESPDVAAVGARLVYPLVQTGPRAGSRFADLTLQHGGVWFAPRDGAPQASPIGAGGDPDGAVAAAVREVPALTAACLLVRRDAFEAVGGFDAGYLYGQEDVDLALRWRAAGWRLLYDGRAVLWHHESATRVLDDRTARRERSVANRERFVGTWACRLSRTTLLDAIAGGGSWRAPRP